jgi:hypothetical protein
MRNVSILAALLTTGMIFAFPVWAEPTITGPTGLIVNPTADITPADHAWIALNFLDNGSNSIWTANVTGSVADNFEIGVGAVHPDSGDDGISFFIKWLFMPEEENWPGTAAGVTITDIAGDNTTMWYAVASKFFYFGESASENASVHGGVSYMSGSGDENFEFFGGLDLEMFDNMLLIAEYNSDQETIYQGFTYGVRYYLDPQVTAQAGFVDGDLTVGASYVF